MADTATTGTAAAAQTNEPLIRVEGLRKSFGSLEVLKGIDLSVNPGDVYKRQLQDHGHAVWRVQGPGQADRPPVRDAAEALQEEGRRQLRKYADQMCIRDRNVGFCHVDQLPFDIC